MALDNIWDDAFHNRLHTPAGRIERYLKDDPDRINKVGGNASLTPLAGACYNGHLDVVTLLLEKGARPNVVCPHSRTALFYTLQQAPPNQLLIVKALVTASDSAADPNEVYPEDDNVNALTLAIEESRDKDIVQALVDSGAKPTPENKKQAKARKMEQSLILHDIPEPKSPQEFKKNMNNFVKNAGLDKFFAKKPAFVQEIAEKASALREDPTTDLGKPENLPRLTKLSLYQLAIYCDDSGSMNWNSNGTDYTNPSNSRYYSLRQLVSRITNIATKLLPNEAVVKVRFINNNFNNDVTASRVDAVMASVSPHGEETEFGINLVEKILRPLVYDRISNSRYEFEQPLLVCVITDGAPYQGSGDIAIPQVIADCKRALVQKKYDPTSVMFCISQIGTDPGAKAFLDNLRNKTEIKDVMYCTTDQLDVKFKELNQNERELEVWLLEMLTKPIMRNTSSLAP